MRDRDTAFITAAGTLTARLDVDSVCHAVLDAVQTLFDATASWLLLHDSDSDHLRTHAFRGEGSDAYRDVTVASSVGVLGLAFRTRQVIFVPDARDDHRWFDPSRVHR